MSQPKASNEQFSLASEVAKAREHIKKSLECMDKIMQSETDINLNKKVNDALSQVDQLTKLVTALSAQVADLTLEIREMKSSAPQRLVCSLPPNARPCVANEGGVVAEKFWEDRREYSNAEAEYYAKLAKNSKPAETKAEPKKAAPKDDDDDDVDLFGSDSEGEDAEAAKIREERLNAYAQKKAKKPALIAKSNIILDVKPWSDETDMPEMEKEVRSIKMEGLLWGASKFVPLAFGIKKLQISCVVEDDKVSIDLLQEEIEKFEELVQSVDIAAFNKI